MRNLICFPFVSALTLIATMSIANAAGSAASNVEESWSNIDSDMPRLELFQRLAAARHSTDPQDRYQPFPFVGAFVFPKDATYDVLAHKPRTAPVVFGIDLNHYSSPKVRLDMLKEQGICFALVKATQGTQFKDQLFATYWPALDALPPTAKLMRGAYHFLSASVDGKQQADRFVAYVQLHGGFTVNDLPPAVDLEWDKTKTSPDQWRGHDPDEILDNVQAWLDEVELLTHRRPMIYTNQSWWIEITTSKPSTRDHFRRFARYPIWIADYSRSGQFAEKPDVPLNRIWTIWQFTASSQLSSGYPSGGKIDADVYKGTLEQFKTDLGIPGRD